MTSIFPDMGKIEKYLEKKFEVENLKITSVWKNLEGWSMETFSIGLQYQKDEKTTGQDIIIREEPVSGLLEPYDVSIEYRVLVALDKTDVVVPKPFWYESDPEVLGRPFYVMEKVEGFVHKFKRTSDPDYLAIPDDEERESLADGFVKNISRLHNADWKNLGLGFLGDPGVGTGSALQQIEYWEEVINRAGFGKKPVVAYAMNYLKDHLVENDKVAIVHGDYRTGNFIARDKKIVAVLDWEMVHLGDPMEDISYILMGAWRSARPLSLINHLLPIEDFFKQYEAESGIKIDNEKIKFYHLFNNFKAIGIAATAANAFKTKVNKDLKPGVFGNTLYYQFFNMMNALNKYLSA